MEINMKNLLIALFLLVSTPLFAQSAPLLMDGKTALFQRILTIPDAKIAPKPDSSDTSPTIPFTAYYIYDEITLNGDQWLKLGSKRFGDIDGWVKKSDTLQWNQGLTVAFRNPTNANRTLLFKDKSSLKTLINNKDKTRYQTLYQAAANNKTMADSPVVAIQPASHIDIKKDFYLVPIRDYEDIFVGSEQARMLQISSIPLKTTETISEQKTVVKASPKNYTAGISFAIDSTLSMGPYIKRTQEAVLKIYDSLGDAGLLGNVNFGLSAFRDNQKSAPANSYLTKTYVNLEQGRNPGTFLTHVNDLTAATYSTNDFVEDSFAGVKDAIDNMGWDGHNARYIVLVSDAGARGARDPLSSTGLSAQELNKLARDKGIAIFVLHLLAPYQQADHAAAAKTYKALSNYPGIGSLYYGVPTGDVTEFGNVLDAIATQITQQVNSAQGNNKLAASPDYTNNAQLAGLQQKIEKLGFALRMQYIPNKTQKTLPKVFDAWLLDRDFNDPTRKSLDVRILLTRDQLSDMHDILRQVLTTAEDGLLSPQGFINELKSLSATITRDPSQLGETTAVTAGQGQSLAQMGFMAEYIEDLPYKSEVMSLSLEDWQNWQARQQIDFIHRLEDKIDYYRALHDHTDLWISLDGKAVSGSSIFPVMLDMLP